MARNFFQSYMLKDPVKQREELWSGYLSKDFKGAWENNSLTIKLALQITRCDQSNSRNIIIMTFFFFAVSIVNLQKYQNL